MSAGGMPPQAGGIPDRSRTASLTPDGGPSWLRPLVDNADGMAAAHRHRLPADALAMLTAAKVAAMGRGQRDAAVLMLFSGPEPAQSAPDGADLLVTVRASTLRHHAGQAAFPGGAADPDDEGPVHTALREAHEETGVDLARLHPLVTMQRMFIAPSGFHVVPVLAYSPDPGPVAVVDEAETAVVARVPLRAFINPENRVMVYPQQRGRRWAGPAFLLNEMLVWGFTGQVISAMLDVAGWAQPWDTADVRELDEAMGMVDNGGSARR